LQWDFPLISPPDNLGIFYLLSMMSRKKGEKSRRKEKPTLQKSYSIGFESSGIAETIRDSNNLAVPIAPRPAVIAQGNWKFVEQLLQVSPLIFHQLQIRNSEMICIF
jgi:hypothetical protein